MMEKPLTASELADALGCFNNAAMSMFHYGNAPVCCIAAGIQAVEFRLREISETKLTSCECSLSEDECAIALNDCQEV